MVFEYYEGGVPRLPRIENEQYKLQIIRKLACQLLITLMHTRKWGILHADLKLENIVCTTGMSTYFVNDDDELSFNLLSNGVLRPATSLDLRVIDFGNAMKLEDVVKYFETFQVQTLAYRAPEVRMPLRFYLMRN
ncbi:13090_t:CDS:1 [Acaulospora colombiana]|uniref:13090_t:CDS:1 n=1 Tax=Acaulospora colombiana TaxID=27376 RepID=A0ACA9MF34_9GLOM|nr:13090_t:CDS:1 [Acaulospora colombiana]